MGGGGEERMMKFWSMFLFWFRTRCNLRTRAAPADDVVCAHGEAMDVHCCNCHSGFIFERDHVCPPALEDLNSIVTTPFDPVDPMEVGIDWAKGCDIAAYTCIACGFETGIVEQIVKHMKLHGATRLTVIPVNRPPAYGTMDRLRRG
jgi:hypothetical protein